MAGNDIRRVTRQCPLGRAAGEPLPCIRPNVGHMGVNTRGALVLRQMYERALDAERSKMAAIPVERIHGPVLFVSGADDQVWPSERMGWELMARLRQAGHPFRCEHLVQDDAGHGPGRLPGVPAAATESIDPVTGLRVALGGTSAGNARSAATAWPVIVRFLRQALGVNP